MAVAIRLLDAADAVVHTIYDPAVEPCPRQCVLAEFDVRTTVRVQPRQVLRGAARPIGRQGTLKAVTIVLDEVFPSLDEAALFAAEFPEHLPAFKKLLVISASDSVLYQHAALEGGEARVRGVNVVSRYQFLTGAA